MNLLLLALLLTYLVSLEGYHYEWLVPEDLHDCCEDMIPDKKECKVVDGAAYFNSTGILFMGGHYVASRFKSNHFPEIMLDQSVKRMGDFDFGNLTNYPVHH